MVGVLRLSDLSSGPAWRREVFEVRVYGTLGHVEPTGHDYRIGLPDQATGADLVNAWAPFGIAALAGPAAEGRIRGAEHLRPCGEADVAHVEGWLRQITHPDEYESAASWLTSHAVWLVDSEWPAIGRVAAALLKRRVLTGDEVAELAA